MNHKNYSLNTPKKIIGFLAGALTTAFAATLCCIAPLLYLVFGISAAGLTGLSKLTWLQWPMTIISLGFTTFGTYRLFFSKKPLCTGIIQRKHLVILYFISLPIILFMLTYPFVLPWILEFLE